MVIERGQSHALIGYTKPWQPRATMQVQGQSRLELYLMSMCQGGGVGERNTARVDLAAHVIAHAIPSSPWAYRSAIRDYGK